ncbi:MAG: response regulator [Planctomycetes bacterium]|nr:response regulator [Planctomycetota bacterium]
MIIDDDEDLASATSQTLRDAGHEVQIELDIKSATESLENRRPDLVILDVMFPEDSSGGFKMAWRIRSEYRIPVLMVTAVNAERALKLSTQDIDDVWLPVADFVEKPVAPDVLIDKVSRILKEGSSEPSGPK